MDDPLLWFSAAGFALLLVLALDLLSGWNKVPDLDDVPDGDDLPGGAPWPRLSIVVAARDEERHLESAMTSLLALDYPALEIVAVDDRSADATGAILDRLAASDARLRVLHVRELPAGWLGKNHALQRGAERAAGELILFTDADVVFQPRALRKTVRLMLDRRADHLALVPDIHVPGLLASGFVATFGLFFTVFTRPWKVPDPKSRAHLGIGAFNLVRATAWHAVGGHTKIALRPDDDLKLGKILKQGGFRALAATGRSQATVEWYATLGEAVRGLEKNMFAGVEYSVAAVVFSTAMMCYVWLWPFVGVVVASGAARWTCAAAIVVEFVLYVLANRRTRVPPWMFLLFPIGSLLFVYCFWRSMILALVRGGIVWRGTLYPLAALRANRV